MQKATNAEKLAAHIVKYGTDNILLHRPAGTPYWLVMQRKKDGWDLTLCLPLETTTHRVAEGVSDENVTALWNDLIRLKLKHDIELSIKALQNFMHN